MKPFHKLKSLYLTPKVWAPLEVYFENQVLMCTLQITKKFWHEKDENLFRGVGYAGFERKGMFLKKLFLTLSNFNRFPDVNVVLLKTSHYCLVCLEK